MFWQITAAVAATIGLLFAIFVFTYPHLQRWRRSKPLSRIDELRKKMISLHNQYSKPGITDAEMTDLKKAIGQNKAAFINELKKISKEQARKYESIGFYKLGYFKGIDNTKHSRLLASNRTLIEITEKVIDKYT